MESKILCDDVLDGETQEKDVDFSGQAHVLTERVERFKRWGFWPSWRIVEEVKDVPVYGSVKVLAEYFVTFPSAKLHNYPDTLGRPVRVMSFKGVPNWIKGESND